MEQEDIKRIQLRRIVHERVPESNCTVAKVLLIFAGICLLVLGLFHFGLLKSESVLILTSLFVIPLVFSIMAILCLKRKGQGKAWKYIFFILLAIFWLNLEIMTGYKVKLLLPVFLIMSLMYYDRDFIIFTYVLALIALYSSICCNSYLYNETGLLDLNVVSIEGYVETVLNGNLINEAIALQPSPYTMFMNGMRMQFFPNLIFITVTTGLAFVFMKANLLNILKAEEMSIKIAEEKAELADAKTKLVLSQVKPHFIYNALSSIAAYCTEDPDKAQQLTLDFSDYLRNNLDTLNEGTSNFCSFETELKHLKSYLNIEKCRFEENLNVEYDIKVSDFDVPVLCIQPIVENAVKHGVTKKENGGTVKISTKETKDGYLVIVKDDGVGFDKNKVGSDGKTHVGLANIKKRLMLFGGKMEIESTQGKGTTVTVFLPKRKGLV